MIRHRRLVPRYLREEASKATGVPLDWDEYRRKIRLFQDAARLVRSGDPAGLPVAVGFLVDQPRFFGSGYLFEEVAAAVAVGADAGPFIRDIHRVVLAVAHQPLRRETRYAARLAVRYWTEPLEAQLRTIPTAASRRILARAPEIRKSYRSLGLL